MNWIEHSYNNSHNFVQAFFHVSGCSALIFVSDDTKESEEGLVFIITARISTIHNCKIHHVPCLLFTM